MGFFSYAPFGYDGAIVEVEVDLRSGMPATDLVGLSEGAVKESRERIYSAIKNSGFNFPQERVLISLSPADLRKDGAIIDLAIAISILKPKTDKNILILGELDFTGKILPVRGVYAACVTAKEYGIDTVIVSNANYKEALESGIKYVTPCSSLEEVYYTIQNGVFLENKKEKTMEKLIFEEVSADEDNIKLTNNELNALLLGAVGRFNMLFTGSSGCGKTLLAQKLKYLIPSLSYEESLSVTRIWSLAGLVKPNEPLKKDIPFRMPHQTASIEGICGGGPNCYPGEISLAHNGVLFLDEAADFRSSVLQMLRVPLDNHSITLSRAGRQTIYPANFQLVMTMLPCPCGNYGEKDKICLCSAYSVEQYWKKISDPLLYRIPIRLKVEKNEVRGNYSIKNLQIIIADTVERIRSLSTPNKWISQWGDTDFSIPEVVKEWFDYHCEKHDVPERMKSSMLRMWVTLALIFGDTEENYRDYFDDVISLTGSVY